MTRRQRQLCLYVIGAAWVVLSGCASQVIAVAPRVNLGMYERIGMIELVSSADGDLPQLATQKLMHAIQSAQPGVRILELGDESRVLGSIEHDRLDFEAIQAIGERYRVDAVLVGQLEVTDNKPKVTLSTRVKSMSARVDVEASLSAKLLETETGSTLWTNSVRGRETVAHVKLQHRGPSDFSAGDPEDAYGKLVQSLAHQITGDFRVRYERL